MYTEDEAKKKWCPHSRVLGTLVQPAAPGAPDYTVAAGAQNRGYAMDGPLEKCRCIGSACMAWRWVRALDPTLPIDHAPMKTEYGFCGLSGAPS